MSVGYSIKKLKEVSQWFRDHPTGMLRVHTWPVQELNQEDWRKWFIDCLNTKINRFQSLRGRKDTPEYFWEMMRTQRELNNPRLIIHWLPRDLKKRFAYRMQYGD